MKLGRELPEASFHATFVAPMHDVASKAEELVDLWAYLDPVLGELFPKADDVGLEWRVAFIRESGDGRFQHIGVPVPRSNAYIVVVVDVPSKIVVGHHLLNLGEKYGLAAGNT